MNKNEKMRPYILAETNYKEILETDFDVAVLPWGATEAHNYHMPYGTDNMQVEHVAAKAAGMAWEKGAKVLVLPVIPFGVNTGQRDVPFCMNMNPSTQAAVLEDLLEVLDHHGIRKLVVLNGHGGNNFKPILREAGYRWPDMVITLCNWFEVETLEDFFDEPGDHADEMESSAMMHLRPELVMPLSQAGDGAKHPFKIQALRDGWVWKERDWLQATDDTGSGNPRKATADKGERFLSAVCTKLAGFLYDFAQADPNALYE